MLIIFESLVPVFLLIALGVFLKRSPIVTRDFWPQFERFSFYLLFPVLIFLYIAIADFSKLTLGGSTLVLLLAVFTQLALMWILKKPLKYLLKLENSSYSSLYQTATRFNGFILIAIAQNAYGNLGATIAVLVMACFILPLNVINVIVVVALGAKEKDDIKLGFLLKRVVTNPLVLACFLGLFVQVLHIPIYQPLINALDLIARGTLGMGLIMVGAALRIRDVVVPNPAMFCAAFFKLLFFPLILAIYCQIAGITGLEYIIIVLGGAMPTAMNGYLVARQYNGDAELYAAISVLQTLASFFTISLIMYLVN